MYIYACMHACLYVCLCVYVCGTYPFRVNGVYVCPKV